MVPIQIPHTPTSAEVAEVEKVRGMQIRKDAMALAVQHFAGEVVDDQHLIDVASAIELFILGTE